MRHQKKRHKLGRTASHRKATLAALSTALIQHKRITTTEPKAKALRVFIEPLITRAKEDTSHNRRQVFRRLQDNDAVSELFTEVSAQVGDRPGGYTRVVKLGRRAGDGAALAVIELVDYNDVQPDEGTAGRSRSTRRGGGKGRRRSGSKGTEAQQTAATDTATETTKQVEAASKDVETAVVEEPVAEEQAQPVQARTEDEAPQEQVEAARDTIEEQKAEAGANVEVEDVAESEEANESEEAAEGDDSAAAPEAEAKNAGEAESADDGEAAGDEAEEKK